MTSAAPQHTAQQRLTVLLTTVAAVLYLSLSWWMVTYIRLLNGQHFVYSLDDPYIHLALSEWIAQGHYGINPGEFASPASSVLWPYLLAPFVRFAWQPHVPLYLNLLAGIGTCLLIGAVVARWPTPKDVSLSRWHEIALRLISTVALVFVANLVGLTFTGMEHTLQVLLAGASAWGIIACLRGRAVPWWCLVAAAVGPSVRYENLGISLALALALLGRRQTLRAVTLFLASLTPPVLFSIYLHRLGLPWLPTSVLVKSRVPGATGVGQRGLLLVGQNLGSVFTDAQRLLVLLLFLTLLFAASHQRGHENERGRRFALWGAALAEGLHLLVGRFNWLHRYEVYAVFFGVLVVLQLVQERGRGLPGWYVLGLLGCCFPYVQALRETPISANQVYRQQYQTKRFLNDFYDGDVAVNDLGLASYRRRSGTYILDLWGLASVEAAEEQHKTTPWLDNIVRQHNVGLVVIYPLWFPPIPSDWTLLGELCLDDPPIVLGGSCVSFYATPEASLPEVREEFDNFVHTLPGGITERTAGHLPVYR